MTFSAFAAGELFAPRAAFLQVGAMLGTIMAANVFFVIIPAHWELVRAKQEGREPDPMPGCARKQRSVHNNYLTLPVVFTMLAGHFPLAFGAGHAWLVLLAIFAIVRRSGTSSTAGTSAGETGGSSARRRRGGGACDRARSGRRRRARSAVSDAAAQAVVISAALLRGVPRPAPRAPLGVQLDTPSRCGARGRDPAHGRRRTRCRPGT